MPMNAPVTPTTGTDRTPTSYICGNSSRQLRQLSPPANSQAKVRATKSQKFPNAANESVVAFPSFSIALAGISGRIIRVAVK